MDRGLTSKLPLCNDYLKGQKDLAQQIYDIIINEDNSFRFIRYHTDRERAQYCNDILMKIYNNIKQILGS